MKSVLMECIRKEKVTAICSIDTAFYRELYCTTITYVKKGTYYCCVSYYTDTWISSVPLGPRIDENGLLVCSRLSDIATITQYKSFADIKSVHKVSDNDLANIYFKLDEVTSLCIDNMFSGKDVDIEDVTFHFSPEPRATASIFQSDEFLGVVGVTLKGDISIICRASDKIDSIIRDVHAIPIGLSEDNNYE